MREHLEPDNKTAYTQAGWPEWDAPIVHPKYNVGMGIASGVALLLGLVCTIIALVNLF